MVWWFINPATFLFWSGLLLEGINYNFIMKCVFECLVSIE